MSPSLEAFFSIVSTDQALQERLYVTKELSEVVSIAKEYGVEITAEEVVCAQAQRMLLLSPEDVAIAAAGGRPENGAQWGREGNGYLDRGGYWLAQFIRWGYSIPHFEPDLVAFVARVGHDAALCEELATLRTYNDVVAVAQALGYHISGPTLARYQALIVLQLDDSQAEKVAGGVIG